MDRIAIISPDASDEIREHLKALDIEPVAVPRTGLVEPPISGHPDIQVFVHKNRIFCHPDISGSFVSKIEARAEVVICGTRLRKEYPGDIPYNIACAGRHAFHHRTGTDPVIREYLASEKIGSIEVRQGYAKCSTMIIDEEAVITSDASIDGAASSAGIESLLIRPGSVELPGYRYGFIGGASGRTDGMVLCTGRLDHHPDYDRIVDFIFRRGKKMVCLSREPAIDLGTIFII